jgi:hypothetical protein
MPGNGRPKSIWTALRDALARLVSTQEPTYTAIPLRTENELTTTTEGPHDHTRHVRHLSREEYIVAERHLVRKLDRRLMPILFIIIVLK